MNCKIHIALWLIMLCSMVSCSVEHTQEEDIATSGVLTLRMSSDEVYVQTTSRATLDATAFSHFAFTLRQGEQTRPISFVDGSVVLEAGTYVLSATNSVHVEGGYLGALFEGASAEFTITPGAIVPVTIDLGKPKNCKVTLSLSNEFTSNYTLTSFTLSDGEREVTLTSTDEVAYFPPSTSTLTYALVAAAKSNTHVQDIDGATGEVTIEGGKHTPLIFNLNPIDPNLVIIETDTDYSGEFQ